MEFGEYVEFAVQTNRLDFYEDPISGKGIFRIISIANQWVNK